MRMRNIELIIISNNLEKYKDKKLPQKISYAITKNNMLIMQEQKIYIEEFNKIIKEYDKYIIKDTDGQMKLNTNGIPMVKAEVEKEYMQKVNDLLNIEFDIENNTEKIAYGAAKQEV